ncbi:RNA methyltransferase, RsmE family protein [Orientia chuto str. Dubai]|uniref:Ribosomal RNA small subunit methyltransferase E n=1 Tax=Orientia chuto str. Dubai TaxID=1359168 RepID=A0A0F3MJH5_9RICK|nr:RsmE family RNA methyltransferase [Candidatus Orientia mediorientalis]KJV55928.1 RNA methyltransferase, RsmE family protein [Orientia chuto str. Dubai]
MKLKKLHRLYSCTSLNSDTTVELSKEQIHYLINVLRCKNNDQIRVFNNIDGEYLAIIHFINYKQVLLQITNQIRRITKEVTENNSPLVLAQCIVKPEKMSRIIDMATQIGITHIVPIISEYSQYLKFNTEKYNKIIIESCRQSEQLTFPILSSPITLANFLYQKSSNCILLANEQETVQQIYHVPACILSKASILIGPEGGFSEQDLTILGQVSKTGTIKSISLGKNILRSETAAIYFLSQLQLLRVMHKHTKHSCK